MGRVRELMSAFTATAILSIAATGCASAQERSAAVQSGSGPITTHELVEARGLSGLAVSPDGAYAVVRVDRQDIGANQTFLDWQVLRLRDGQATRVGDAGAPRWNVNGYIAVETPQWSPDGAWVYFRKLQGEEVQLWRVSRDGGRHEQLTHDVSDVQAFIVAPDGSVTYAVGPATRDEIKAAEAIEYDNGVLLDDTIIKGFPITHGFPVNGRMATYRRLPGALNVGRSTLLGDAPLLALQLDVQHRNAIPANDAVSRRFAELWTESAGGARPFDPGEDARATSQPKRRVASLGAASPASADLVDVSRSGRVLSWRGEGHAGTTCQDSVCTDADDITIVGWAANGRDLIFQTRTFETVRLSAWNVEADVVRTVMQTEGVLGSYDSGVSGECQLTAAEAICIAAAADQPPQVVGIDLSSGSQRILYDPNPGLSPDRLGAARKITLMSRFGSSTVGRLILPRTRGPQERLPLVITSYGCRGFLLGGTGRDVPEHVLAGKGYAAICVDLGYNVVRRPTGSALTRADSDLSFVEFFENAVRVLDQQAIIDPDRVELTGFSGSATATAYAITQSRLFTAAAVTTEGSLDPIVCYLTAHFRSCEEAAEREGFKRPYDSRSGILRDSPALNVEKISTPLLMQLPEVEYVAMTQLYAAMVDYGRAVEMYVFADAYHYKNQARQRLAVYNRNVDWINFWLRGQESSAPDRSAQNSRWRMLRETQCKLFTGVDAIPDPPWYCRR